MTTILSLLLIVLGVSLVLVASMQPLQATVTKGELVRRAKKSKEYKKELQRSDMYDAIRGLLRTYQATAAVLFVGIAITLFGWAWGVVLSVACVLVYPLVTRISYARRLAAKVYTMLEPHFLALSPRFQQIVTLFRAQPLATRELPREIYSREDLADLIEHSPGVVGAKERALLGSALSFFDKKVAEVMTPRTVIDFIKESEFLGPLVLDELHLLGHSRLPVINDSIDHVVGILHLRDLLSLSDKTSATAGTVMEKKVYYIREDATLEHALGAFITTRHHLFIVINKNRETVGLVTLEDVIEALIGRRIVDEDDVYDDLREVAEKEGATNNTPINHVDV